MRTLITPGRLYAKIATEFRQVCCSKCARCVLPVPAPTREGGWNLGELPGECEDCARAIQEIVQRNRAEYELLDPFSEVTPTVTPRPPLPPQYRPTRH